MKITLVNATFYFSGNISLTPSVKEVDVKLETLEDAEIRQLHLGYSTGVISITDGTEEFLERYATIIKPSKADVNKEVITEAVKETTTKEVEATPVVKKTTTKASTTKKTATKE